MLSYLNVGTGTDALICERTENVKMSAGYDGEIEYNEIRPVTRVANHPAIQ